MNLSLADVVTTGGMMTLGQVILIDLTMAGDNVVIMGTLAAGLPERDRRRVIMLGVGMALVFLISFALLATWLLKVPGLLLAGGLMLLWVAWKMWSELRIASAADDPATPEVERPAQPKSFLAAAIQVTIADLSMSLDNVLAVAAAAREHPTVLFFGLALSVTLMGLAANFVAKLVERYRWIAYVGLVVILYVAANMVWDGAHDVAPLLARLR